MAGLNTSVLQPSVPGSINNPEVRIPYREPVIGLGQGEAELGQGLSSLNTGLELQQRAVQAQDNEQGSARALTAIGQIHTWAQQQMDAATTSSTGAALGFTADYNDNLNQYVAKMVDNEPNAKAKQQITAASVGIQTSMTDQAQRFQATQMYDSKVNSATGAADQLSSVVANDRSQYGVATMNYQNQLSSLGLPPATQSKLAIEADIKLKTAAVQNWIANDPRGAWGALSTRLGVPNAPQPNLPAPPNPNQLTITAGSPGSLDTNAIQNDTSQQSVFTPEQEAGVAADARKSGSTTYTVPGLDMGTGKPINITRNLNAPVQVASAATTSNDAQTFAYQPDAAPIDTKIPYIDGLPLDHVLSLRNEAHAQIQQGMSQSRIGLERDLQNIKAAADAGGVAPDVPYSRFLAAYDPATAQAKYQDMQDVQTYGTQVRAIQPMSNDAIAQYTAQNDPRTLPGGTDAPDFARKWTLFKAMIEASQHVIAQRSADPMLAASTSKMATINPISLSDANATVNELQNRQQVSASLSGGWAPDVPPLTTKEAQTFGGIMRTAPVQQQMQILGSFQKGLTDPGTYMRAMQQIQPDAPELGIAGALVNKGQSGAAELILNGSALLHPNKQDKATDGAGHAPDMPNDGALKSAFADTVGDAFRGDVTGRSADQAYQAFRYYYAGAAARDGALVDANKNPDSKRVQDAVDGALGGVASWNGHSVIKPYGMPDDTFKTVFANQFTQSMQRNGYTFGDRPGATPAMPLDAYTPVSVGDGRYLLQAGAGYLPNSKAFGGGPMVIQMPDYVPPTGPQPATFMQRLGGALPTASKTESAGAFEGAQP